MICERRLPTLVVFLAEFVLWRHSTGTSSLISLADYVLWGSRELAHTQILQRGVLSLKVNTLSGVNYPREGHSGGALCKLVIQQSQYPGDKTNRHSGQTRQLLKRQNQLPVLHFFPIFEVVCDWGRLTACRFQKIYTTARPACLPLYFRKQSSFKTAIIKLRFLLLFLYKVSSLQLKFFTRVFDLILFTIKFVLWESEFFLFRSPNESSTSPWLSPFVERLPFGLSGA